jgi:ATP-binding cassette subfamily B multidrug efflux pump
MGWHGGYGGYGGGMGGGFGAGTGRGKRKGEKDDVRQQPFGALLRKVMPLFVQRKRQLLYSFVLLLIITVSQLAGPLVLQYILDKAIPDGNVGALMLAAGMYLAIAIAGAGVGYLQAIALFRMGISVVTELKTRLFEHVLKLGLDFHEDKPPGVLLSRVESDAETLNQLFSTIAVELLRNGMLFIGILAVMLAQNHVMTALILLLLPLMFGATALFFTKMKRIWRETRVQNAIVVGYVAEYVQGIEVIQQFNYERRARERMREVNQGKYDIDIKEQFYSSAFWSAFSYGEILATIIVLLVGVRGVFLGTMSIGTLVLFFEYIRQLFQPIAALSEQLSFINRSFVSIERVFGILETEPTVVDVGPTLGGAALRGRHSSSDPLSAGSDARASEDGGHGGPPHREFNTIAFANVWFAYDSTEDGEDKPATDAEPHWVLRDVSFTLRRGERLALVGASGGGKSTVVKLLLRFHDPVQGRITVDGTDIRDIPLHDWRELVGLVLQDIYLFPGTVADNLRVFRDDIPLERVEAAVEAAQAKDIVARLPGGLEGQLSERGANLSVGERQLLSFARALAVDPQLLVLDEATSSVDPYTERKVQRALTRLLEGRTAVIVAHRLSTILSADQILLIQRGEVAEHGTHAELLALGGLYAKLFRLQFGDLAVKPGQEPGGEFEHDADGTGELSEVLAVPDPEAVPAITAEAGRP